MRNITDIVSGLLLLGLVLFGFSLTTTLPKPLPGAYFGPASFPNLILTLIAIGACGLIAKALFIRSSLPTKIRFYPRALCFIFLFFGYLIAFLSFGFLIATVPFLIAAQLLFGRSNIITICITALVGTAGIYAFITYVFKVPLP